MSKISIKAAKEQALGKVELHGFVQNIRLMRGLVFIDLRDSSGNMQLVVEEKIGASFTAAEALTLESFIKVVGELKEKPAKKNDPNPVKDWELSVSSLEIISLAEANLPIPVLNKIDNEANIDNRFDWRWLDLRRPEHRQIFQVWTQLEVGFREQLLAEGFMQIYTPCFMNTASETGSEVFEVKYFDRQAYLSQSPQFYKQMAIASGFEKVFMTGPVFRAEASYTSRHVTEFTGWDFEFADIESHHDIMALEERTLIRAFGKVKELGLDIEIPAAPFPKMSLAEVKEKLKAAGIKSEKDYDLSPEEEREICRLVKEEFNHDFIFVTDYPIAARPFYHMRHADNPGLTKSFDLLYRGLEVTTGSQREHRLDVLEKQALEKEMNLEELHDYFNFFRYGCPAHGGVGIGPARLVMKIVGADNVKEACFLPRDAKRLRP
ncbi:MAG TPA: aspartate--tRNA(Asn) ligase [bacterium]|jgi:aspartyl-tRNA synthetase|nr:MAG: Asparagine--tRNA ligase [Parcubacteria group bacterium ADurb.Bin115]HNU81114.1 aspartate--tRNA(Asn) ligase [bacterium]HOD87287.1 aspartate--tRNA(Asn) ligase [bacterium]HPW05704.1 aspartate--tRNA(Asn) ligase [bacterium]HQB75992.1 aspartate--tRNA(Asn) ligase [bacterium]